MCRMLGLTNFIFQRHKKVIENFFELARSGKFLPEDSPGHLDGWGIGFYRNGKVMVHKSGGSILKERREFFEVCRSVKSSNILLLHLRKSSWKDTSRRHHAHPFAIGNTLFVHNGTVRDYKTLRQKIVHHPPTSRALDSEVYFHYIMEFISLGLAKAFRKATREIISNHSYSSLTCLFSDGNRLYGFREYTKAPWYYSLYYAFDADTTIVASEPVSPDLRWKMIPRGRLMVFKVEPCQLIDS